jgi:hypothetical protein
MLSRAEADDATLPGKCHIQIRLLASVVIDVERLVNLAEVLFSNPDRKLTVEPGVD